MLYLLPHTHIGDPSGRGRLLHISLEDFQSEVHPTLSPRDAVLVVQGLEDPIPEDFLHRCVRNPNRITKPWYNVQFKCV